MATATGVSSPEPPDPPDLTSVFTIPSTSGCFLILILTISNIDLKIQTFKNSPFSHFHHVVFIRPLTGIVNPSTGHIPAVFLDCLSFVKYDCLPYVPFGLSGCVAGSIVPNIMYASMFVLLKGLSIWCFVTSACDAEFLIVKAASVAVSITGVRPVRLLSNPQSLISLLSMIGVEFRGLLSDIK
ncbi:hypothetical protein HA466_0156600 [Hirschfeldia incana]|nr:hypothetical protein HA466_0156600 [Hirschfeldia incana]